MTRSATPGHIAESNEQNLNAPLFYVKFYAMGANGSSTCTQIFVLALCFLLAEQDKLDYNRDHCKSIVFDILKAGYIASNVNDRSGTADEVVKELDSTLSSSIQ